MTAKARCAAVTLNQQTDWWSRGWSAKRQSWLMLAQKPWIYGLDGLVLHDLQSEWVEDIFSRSGGNCWKHFRCSCEVQGKAGTKTLSNVHQVSWLLRDFPGKKGAALCVSLSSRRSMSYLETGDTMLARELLEEIMRPFSSALIETDP